VTRFPPGGTGCCGEHEENAARFDVLESRSRKEPKND
jgi:hypothetical protein